MTIAQVLDHLKLNNTQVKMIFLLWLSLFERRVCQFSFPHLFFYFVFFVIVLSELLFTASGYHFIIFKLFLSKYEDRNKLYLHIIQNMFSKNYYFEDYLSIFSTIRSYQCMVCHHEFLVLYYIINLLCDLMIQISCTNIAAILTGDCISSTH